MKTTYNKREIAQRERAKNLSIYNEAAAIARDVFNRLDIEAGKYSAAEVAAAIEKNAATWDESAAGWSAELVKIEAGGFCCRFPRAIAFDILKKMGTGYNIATAARAIFERTAEENERRAADIETAAERQAAEERRAQMEAEAAARAAEEKRARRRENDRRRRAEKKAEAARQAAEAERQAAEAEAAERARRAAMTPAEIEAEAAAWSRRMDATARRCDIIKSELQKFSAAREVAQVHKIFVVTVAAYGKIIFKAWAVGISDSFYFLTGEIDAGGVLTKCDRSYKKENRAAVANWLTMTRRAAIVNGWSLYFYSERPAAAADSYFLADIATATETAVKNSERERRAALLSLTAANDDTAAPAADIETRKEPAAPAADIENTTANDGAPRRRAGKSLDDIQAQRERIKAAALDIVLTREGHSDGRTKEDRRQRPRLELVNLIYNVYFCRVSHYFARANKKTDRAAVVPADIYAPAVPTMTATANDITINFAPYMEPGPWKPSANTFAELCEGLKHAELCEFCRAEIERRAIEAAHEITGRAGLVSHSATANELTAVFMSGVDRWAAETAPRFATVDDFINNMVPTSATANDDTAAPAADPDSEAPAAPAADIETRQEPAAVISLAANFARCARRWFQIAAAVLVVFIISSAPILTDPTTPAPAADIETREEPAALLSLTAANDDTAAPAAEPDSEAPAAPAADIETREEPAALLSLTAANDDTAAPAATLYEAGEITETSDPAAVPSADAAANDDTANDAPAIANDDTANDDTAAPAESDTDESDSQSDTAPTSAATGATATPSTAAPASVVIVNPAPAWFYIIASSF